MPVLLRDPLNHLSGTACFHLSMTESGSLKCPETVISGGRITMQSLQELRLIRKFNSATNGILGPSTAGFSYTLASSNDIPCTERTAFGQMVNPSG